MAQPYEVVAVIGEESLISLQMQYGGSYVYIPATKQDSQSFRALSRVIGAEKTTQLIDTLPGERTWIGKDRLRRLRNREILRLTLVGSEMGELSKRYGLTRRAIRIITQAELPIQFGMRQRQRRSVMQRLELELEPIHAERSDEQQLQFEW